MKTDKNTVIGFVLLAGLFFVYFWYTSKQQNEIAAYKLKFDDSVAMVKANALKAAGCFFRERFNKSSIHQ